MPQITGNIDLELTTEIVMRLGLAYDRPRATEKVSIAIIGCGVDRR